MTTIFILINQCPGGDANLLKQLFVGMEFEFEAEHVSGCLVVFSKGGGAFIRALVRGFNRINMVKVTLPKTANNLVCDAVNSENRDTAFLCAVRGCR